MMSQWRELAAVSRALCDETRLEILNLLLTRRETCVCELVETLGTTQSNVSFHLTTLKHAGLIADKKIGKWMFYSIRLQAIQEYLTRLREVFSEKRLGTAPPARSIFALCSQEHKAPLSRAHAQRRAAALKRGS
ncbi:MAG: helix-turn-helix transcriptional regulator [Deltaproteobacteria bacterium]|nr:helix-turn-helix transcriptional regulator [Deltaproteobacteria bacterium]